MHAKLRRYPAPPPPKLARIEELVAIFTEHSHDGIFIRLEELAGARLPGANSPIGREKAQAQLAAFGRGEELSFAGFLAGQLAAPAEAASAVLRLGMFVSDSIVCRPEFCALFSEVNPKSAAHAAQKSLFVSLCYYLLNQ